VSFLINLWFLLLNLIKRGLVNSNQPEVEGSARRVVISDGDSVDGSVNDRFVLIIALMVLFFIGLVGLEIFYMLVLRSFSEIIFQGIMLVVGTIVGAVWGNSQ